MKWSDGGAFLSRRPWALLLSVLFFFSALTVKAQSSTPQSQDTGQASAPTTPTEKSELQTLRPLVEQALTSSEDSDQTLLDLNRQIEIDKQQKIADDEQRKKEAEQRQQEQKDSAAVFKTLSDRAGKLQTFSDSVLSKLTGFSGSEDQKQAAALAAVDSIKDGVKALEGERNFWRAVGIGGTAAAVIAIIVAVVK